MPPPRRAAYESRRYPDTHTPRVIEVLTPAGTERWFEEIAALDASDRAGFDEACQRHGITFDRASAWTARIRERYNL